MRLRPRTWFLGRLDAFLTEEQRRSPPDVLGRYRLLATELLREHAPNLAAFLAKDAPRLHASSFGRSGIRVRREYGEIPLVLLDRHKLLQIVVNLLNNARHALLESGREDKSGRGQGATFIIALPPRGQEARE